MRAADQILAILLESHPQGMSGAEISKATKLGALRMYPALGKLEADGIIESEWEKPEPTHEPRRRLYWLADRAALSQHEPSQTEG